jgi:hypothetical protein
MTVSRGSAAAGEPVVGVRLFQSEPVHRIEQIVELDVDCCTSSRMRSIERTTACAPEACSSTEELISWVISVSRLVALAI